MLDTTKETVGGISKSIHPGNVAVRINSITWGKTDKPRANGINLFFHVETKPIGGDFKGFPIDKADLTQGNWEGQVSAVKADNFPFTEFTSKAKDIHREVEDVIIEYINKTLRDAGCPLTKEGKVQWSDNQNNKHSDIESYLNAFCADNPLKDKWYNTLLAGQEKQNGSYLNYYLHFPSSYKSVDKNGAPITIYLKGSVIEPIETEPGKSKLIAYDPEKFLTKEKANTDKPVDSFTNGTEETKSSASTFSLDTEETDINQNVDPNKF